MCKNADAGDMILTYHHEEDVKTETKYLIDKNGSSVESTTNAVLSAVKEFIEHENQNRGGSMSSEECCAMAACFFKAKQNQQKYSCCEVKGSDMKKITSDMMPAIKNQIKRRGR